MFALILSTSLVGGGVMAPQMLLMLDGHLLMLDGNLLAL